MSPIVAVRSEFALAGLSSESSGTFNDPSAQPQPRFSIVLPRIKHFEAVLNELRSGKSVRWANQTGPCKASLSSAAVIWLSIH